MKALTFYTASAILLVLLCSEPSLLWALLIAIDILLFMWCRENLTMRDVCKYTGYNLWYKIISK